MIHERILAWRARGAGAEDTIVDTHGQEAHVGLERLDIHFQCVGSPGWRHHFQFQRGCQDLVSLTMSSVALYDPIMAIPLIT